MSEAWDGQDSILWEYLDRESDELLLKILQQVADDGFAAALQDQTLGNENVAMKLLSMTLVKCLALACERANNDNLAGAFMKLTQMNIELVKVYLLKGMRLPT